MYLNKTPIDAVITDKNGLTIEVDCRVTEPVASGLPAEISIEMPLNNGKWTALKNPCSLRGFDGGLEVEIKELWYDSIFAGHPQMTHARGTFNITHAGQLRVSRQIHWKSERRILKFLLSPVRFLKEHSEAKMVSYSSTPNMMVDLFSLQTTELGEIRFIKFWSIHPAESKGVTAEIRASFAAEIRYDEASSIDKLVGKMREVLTPLSILMRQAITLHGWICENGDGIQKMWFNPLDPNHAPDMAEQPVTDLCFSHEFETRAQAVVEKFLHAPPNTKKAVTLLSVALAPHIERSRAGNFLALFGALEEVLALEKLTDDERKKLRETDQPLIDALVEKSKQIEATDHPSASEVAKRLQGYADSVRTSGPSFNVRFKKFKGAYPALDVYMTDIWPLLGSNKQPGLKQIRDSLAHGLRHKYSPQAIAVAHWHFARLAERLAFLVLNADVPLGIRPNSSLFGGDSWYERAEWESIRASAECSS